MTAAYGSLLSAGEGPILPAASRRSAPLALDRLARLYEETGDRAAAAGTYARLADMWVDADPVLEPIARRAGDRAAALAGG